MLAACCAFTFTSCSDDDDDKNPPVVGIEDVLPEGLPSIDGATIKTNAAGQVVEISNQYNTATFQYGSFSRANTFQVLMTITEKGSDDRDEFYMQLNGQGFVKYAEEYYYDGDQLEDSETWEFDYNSDGQLTKLYRSENESTVTITYSNGDIATTKEVEEDGDYEEYTFVYTNSKYTTAVANKGGVMDFDSFFNIDMDEMGVAYYAGLLGKATKNLPMGYSYVEKEGGSTYTGSETFNWEFNANGLPTKFWEGDYEYDAMTFSWK
ncbi:MAG: DUF4595 domain-containing protein [Lachnoclostridium sp.]|nr:DUF4595 domain-containing protein [Lachnoclostridium sp.]